MTQIIHKNHTDVWKKCRKVKGKTCIVRLKIYNSSANTGAITIFRGLDVVKYKIWVKVWKKCRFWTGIFRQLCDWRTPISGKVWKESRKFEKRCQKSSISIRSLPLETLQILHSFRIFQNSICILTKKW